MSIKKNTQIFFHSHDIKEKQIFLFQPQTVESEGWP